MPLLYSDDQRITVSEQALVGFVVHQLLEAVTCPACGSVFTLHVCGAQPREAVRHG